MGTRVSSGGGHDFKLPPKEGAILRPEHRDPKTTGTLGRDTLEASTGVGSHFNVAIDDQALFSADSKRPREGRRRLYLNENRHGGIFVIGSLSLRDYPGFGDPTPTVAMGGLGIERRIGTKTGIAGWVGGDYINQGVRGGPAVGPLAQFELRWNFW